MRWLFYEAQHLAALCLNVAVAGFRRIWLDAKRDQITLLRKYGCVSDGVDERCLISDQMICGQNQQDGISTIRLGYME
ncbi:hypothetical protein SAMN05216517_106172 [Janthinobacterium sp. OK676]|nr:hypothetical protein SAMN05216517_106172 [Janthinobacterium sp. OK676]